MDVVKVSITTRTHLSFRIALLLKLGLILDSGMISTSQIFMELLETLPKWFGLEQVLLV